MVMWQWLWVGNIKGYPCKMTSAETDEKSFRVNELTTSDVNKIRVFLHRKQLFVTQQMVSFWCEGTAQNYDLALSQ
jgi:hypothetical protein